MEKLKMDKRTGSFHWYLSVGTFAFKKILFSAGVFAALFLFNLSTAAADTTLTVTQIAPLTVRASWNVDESLCGGSECYGYILFWGGSESDNFGSGSGSEVHVYSAPGSYTLLLACQSEGSPPPGCSPQQTINVTGGDTVSPSVFITSPTGGATYATSSPMISLGGTASDNVGVTQITWANNRGGSGTAAGTTTWTAPGITLQSGSNVITVTARDATGNTGTDIITVTYTPPGGAFSVTPSPSSSGVVPGQQNVIPVIYTASATGGGTFTAGSSQGRFITESGFQLGTINRTVIIRLVNGSGMAPESAIVPANVITRALRQKQNRIYYERTFTHGTDTVTTRVALQVVPGSAGPFSLVKMELVFVQGTQRYAAGGMVRLGRATVPRNSIGLKAAAHITYNGSGLLMGQWKVDGQVLGYVSQYLYAGIREVVIESPDVPGLPTYDTGQHRVELEIIQPTTPFDEPIIYYYVTQEAGGGTPQTLQLLSPDDHATAPLTAVGETSPEFRWETLAGEYLYHLELYPAHAAAPHGATLPFGGGTTSGSPGPIISADTQEGYYNLSQANMDNLQPGVEYTWRVQAFQGNELVAASVYWTVSFEVVQAEGGEPYFEFLQITPPLQQNQGPQNLAPTEPQSHWFHFGPRNAYAIEMGTGGFHLPDSMEVIIQGEQGQSTTVMNVAEGQEVSIVAGLKNPGNQERQNIRVEFLVDGQLADFSFIPVLAPGQLVTVQTTYEVPDAFSHTVEVKATEGEGAEAVILASISGYMENAEGEQTQLPTEPPEEGYWIGAFNLKPTNVTNPDLNHYTGSGTIEIPFMSEYPVEFSELKINEQEKKVTSGQIRLELGGLDVEIGPVTVHLDAIVFKLSEATCEGSAHIPLVFSSDPLTLDIAGLLVLPEGLSGKLQPTVQTNISLLEPMGFGLTVDPASYVSLSRNQLVASSIDGNLQVPNEFLDLLSGAVGIQFSGLAITNDGGFYGQATLPDTNIGGTNIGVSGTVVLDLTGTTSPTGLPAGFKGVYLQTGKLTFPSEVSLPDLNISGFYVDGTGVNGQVSLSNLGLDLDVGGFSGGLKSITLGFDHNAMTEGSLAGDIHVPFIDTDFDFSLMITANGVETLNLTLAQDKTVSIDALYLNLTIAQGSTIGVENGVGTAYFNGSIGTLQGAPIPISGTDFQGLIIDALGKVDLSGGWINLGNLDTNFHGFPFTLAAVGLGKENSKYFFGLEGEVSICPGKISLAADTRIKILATKSGSSLSYDSTQVDKISVELGVPHAFSFTGEVGWYEDDPVYGHGFKGDMELSAADLIHAEATLMVGNTSGYFYFFIHGDVSFPGGGMPLSPLPLSIYGFNGGAYFNVAPPTDIGETKYIPTEGQYGLMAGIDVGTYDGGYTFNAQLGLQIQISPFSLIMTGDGWVLNGITERSSKPAIETEIELAFDPFVFTASLGVRMDYEGMVRIPATGSGTAEADLKFSEDEWYINFGTKESPISLKALHIFTCSGYFDIGSTGIAMGFAQSLHAGGRWWIFYGYLDTGLKADVAVGYNPFFLYGEVSAWFDVRAGIHVDIWFWEGDIDIINAGVSANLGVRAPNPTKLWGSVSAHFSVLGGIIHGSFSLSFSWSTGSEGDVGGAGDEELQLPPAIVYTYPQEGSTDIPLAAKFFAKFPFTEGEVRTAPTSEGDMDYWVRFGTIRLLYTSADGRTLAVDTRDTGVSNDGMECYFYPKYLLVPNRDYRLRIEAFMEKRHHGQNQWHPDGSRLFWAHFTTGAMVDKWNQYVESTYPRTGQKWVYTNSDVDINFSASMPAGYRAKTYKKSGGGWEEGDWYDLDWINYRRTIHCERFGPNTAEKWLPNTQYEIRVIKSGEVVYKLSFKTSAYENFAQMMAASSLNPRVGWGMDDVPPYLFHVITFNTAEPINWRDVEQMVVRPTQHWTGTPEVEHKIGYSEITANRPLQFLASAGESTCSLPMTGPVKISSIINIDGAHHKNWETLHTIRHYIDYTNLFFTPNLQIIRAMLIASHTLPPYYIVDAAYVLNNTLTLEEKQALWNGLDVAVPTSYQVKLMYRSIDETVDPVSWRKSIIQLEIPEDKLNRW